MAGMKTLVVHNFMPFAIALKRYMYNTDCQVVDDISMEAFKEQYHQRKSEYDLFVFDIYGSGKNQFRTMGLQYGTLLEKQDCSVIYYTSSSGLKQEFRRDFSDSNCFMLPNQTERFLLAIMSPPQPRRTVAEITQCFNSAPLTLHHR